MTVHGTLIASGGEGVLLRGPSGSGKSDLAYRLMAVPHAWQFVADDQVLLSVAHGVVTGTCPPTIRGQIELRGVGIIRVPFIDSAPVRLVIDLAPAGTIARYPEPLFADTELAGIKLPAAVLAAFEASAPLKVIALLGALGGTVVLG